MASPVELARRYTLFFEHTGGRQLVAIEMLQNVLRGDMNLYHSTSIVTASIFASLPPQILKQPPEL
jgi:hypothetical protein